MSGFINVYTLPFPAPNGPFDAGDEVIRAVPVDIDQEELEHGRSQTPGERLPEWVFPFYQNVFQPILRQTAVNGFEPTPMRVIVRFEGRVREIPDAPIRKVAAVGRHGRCPEQQHGKPPVKRGNQHG